MCSVNIRMISIFPLYIHLVGGIECRVVLKDVESIDQRFERVCELLEISMTPREPFALCRECLHICVLFQTRGDKVKYRQFYS
jgi:hypothetical protein